MTAIEVRKDIPVPPHGNAGISRRSSKYPFAELQPGNSFVFPAGTARGKAAAAVTVASKKLPGRRFITRSLGEGLIGCWRIA